MRGFVASLRRLAAALVWVAMSLGAGAALAPAEARPARMPADQTRAFLEDHFAADQQPPRHRARPFDGRMISRFAGLRNRAKARSQRDENLFSGMDPILDGQGSDRPGDIRIEDVPGIPDRPAFRVSFQVFPGGCHADPRLCRGQERMAAFRRDDAGRWAGTVAPAAGGGAPYRGGSLTTGAAGPTSS